LAKVDQPYQASDIVTGERPLPFRFISAREVGDTLIVFSEQGGRGYSHQSTVLVEDGAGWRRLEL
jgi:hypothetical protein